MEVTSRFKGLNLIGRVPDELWMEVHDIVQETEIKTISKKKTCKKRKMAVRGGLTHSCEKKSYAHLNTELQRIARRDGKAILSDHCKEIEENKRMGKTRDFSLQEN